MSRENLANTVALHAGHSNKTVQILVESQGRINYNIANDFKGILDSVKINDVPLTNFVITGFPLEDVANIEELIAENIETIANDIDDDADTTSNPMLFTKNMLMSGPYIFHAKFDIATPIHDTYVNPTGWGKVWITMMNAQSKE